jgi:hypothetical protein
MSEPLSTVYPSEVPALEQKQHLDFLKKAETNNPGFKVSLVAFGIIVAIGLLFLLLGYYEICGAVGTIGYWAPIIFGSLCMLTGLISLAITICKSGSAESTELPEYVSDEVEIGFWEMFSENKDLQSFLEKSINKEENRGSGNAADIVDQYEKFRQEIDPQFSLTQDQKTVLVRSIEKQTKTTSQNRIRCFPTVSDGSCGLHALLGTLSEGSYRTDAAKARTQFCDWIQKKFDTEKKLPECIDNVLDDYFLHFDDAPYAFREAVKTTHETHFKDYNTLSMAQQVQRKTDFKKDALKDYLDNLKKTHVYLLQDEMIAAAECFNKRLVLVQPGWGSDSKSGQDTFNSGATDTVHVWFNGFNHYQRAAVMK